MENETKRQHTWLKENNVVYTGSVFEYKGVQFSIERDASKFYAVNHNTGFRYSGFLRKVSAIYWACQSVKEISKSHKIDIVFELNTNLTSEQIKDAIKNSLLSAFHPSHSPDVVQIDIYDSDHNLV